MLFQIHHRSDRTENPQVSIRHRFQRFPESPNSAMATTMRTQDESKVSHPTATTTSPPIAAPPPAAASSAATSSSHLALLALLIGAVLMSALWFVEPFVAAAELRLPWAAVVGTVVLLAAFFCVSIHLLHSSCVRRPPPAAAAQSEGVWAIAGAVGVGVAACLVAACGAAYGYAPAPARS